MISNQITAFLKQASLSAKLSNKIAETVTMTAVFITPAGQYKAVGVVKLMEQADFVGRRSELYQIKCRFQPGVYFNNIVPYRDDLVCQLISQSETDRVLREFVAIPQTDKDVRSESNSNINNNLDALDTTNLVSYEFQLMDKGFAKLRNLPYSNIFPMANVRDTLFTIMEEKSKEAALTGYDSYKGLSMHEPVDNLNNYRQIIIPSGTRFIDVPYYLQNHNEYGVYSKGLGAFYKQRYWWIYPLYNTNRVDTHPRPIDVIRVPQNKIPDLDSTFYLSATALTIISTGEGEHNDQADIRKQNQGVGQRVVMGDAVAGDTGYHYNNGRAITTRADSLQEYKLSDRRNGEEWVPLNPHPTGNLMAPLSENAKNEGEIVIVEWRNGDTGYLEPGHPVRYHYLYDDDTMMIRRGVLLGYRTDYVPITDTVTPHMKRTTKLVLFLKRQEKYKA